MIHIEKYGKICCHILLNLVKIRHKNVKNLKYTNKNILKNGKTSKNVLIRGEARRNLVKCDFNGKKFSNVMKHS